jgi:hypothetical protein
MSTSTRLPREAKRRKLEQIGRSTIPKEQEEGDRAEVSVEPWRLKAMEAQDYRNESIDEIVPPLQDIKSKYQNCLQIPTFFLDKEEKTITAWTPDRIVRSIANGDIESRTVANAFLRTAGLASKLVSIQERSRAEDT